MQRRSFMLWAAGGTAAAAAGAGSIAAYLR